MTESKKAAKVVVETVQAMPVAKPTFWQKYKLAIVAVGGFVLGAAAEAVTAGYKQQRQLNLVEANDPLVEISEPIES